MTTLSFSAEKKYRIKAFLWDLIIRPLISFFNIKQIQIILIAIAFISITFFQSSYFIIPTIILVLTVVYELIKYYKSGEFMKNYKNYKYPEFRKVIKEIRKERKEKEKFMIDETPKLNSKGLTEDGLTLEEAEKEEQNYIGEDDLFDGLEEVKGEENVKKL